MPRDINGNYTLPAGNPVVSQTTIAASRENSTNEDMAAAIQDSLSRSGKGGMLAPLPFADGSAAAPTITFTSELTTGIFRNAAGEFNFSVQAAKVFSLKAAGLYGEVPFYQLVSGQYAKCTDILGAFSPAGAWNFTSTLKNGGGIVLSHSDNTLASGKITIEQGSGPPTGGSDGDLYFYYA